MTQKHMEFLLGLADGQNRLMELQLATLKFMDLRIKPLESLGIVIPKAVLMDDEQDRKALLTELVQVQEEFREKESSLHQQLRDLIAGLESHLDQGAATIAEFRAMLAKPEPPETQSGS